MRENMECGFGDFCHSRARFKRSILLIMDPAYCRYRVYMSHMVYEYPRPIQASSLIIEEEVIFQQM
jgi:hypothetical protein